MTVAKQRMVFWTGLGLYVISFLPPLVAATVDHPTTIGDHAFTVHLELTGFDCARAALFSPWEENSPRGFSRFSLVISGWINPLLVITMFLALRRKHPQATAILRIMILAMIPFSWMFFYAAGCHPREGHFLWVGGILLLLFSLGLRTGDRTEGQN